MDPENNIANKSMCRLFCEMFDPILDTFNYDGYSISELIDKSIDRQAILCCIIVIFALANYAIFYKVKDKDAMLFIFCYDLMGIPVIIIFFIQLIVIKFKISKLEAEETELNLS